MKALDRRSLAIKSRHIEQIHQLFPCFSCVPDEQWNAAELVAVTPATPHAIREGHLFQHAMFIVSGWIRVYKISPSGREITLYRVQSGECCVLMMASILGEMEYEASVSIEAETEVLLLPVELFKDWMAAFKPIRQFIYKQIIERMTGVTVLLENVAFNSVPSRIADYLISKSTFPLPSSLRITHEQLAVEIGTSREVVSRILKNFANKGAVSLSRGHITIMNHGILKTFLEMHM
ncbi:Crp/Fnr family transcriptional regulator [Paenibacillus sp. LHD-38]|uniref:Crp/Fnr family transcriptional regulator n=1 Tax=Paenibacillus sp. LHD-38 TaxID=3072143 RepID=UPI00280D32A2|nr:Crp/Fnr family transcriptional regulator [Paenibacillus sp. LHD-38]MDQ8735016.1 Crp/Fnr family transcriptional regulator [Paenibacillus sp. LHD-38]